MKVCPRVRLWNEPMTPPDFEMQEKQVAEGCPSPEGTVRV
jgi:hypothetical protein